MQITTPQAPRNEPADPRPLVSVILPTFNRARLLRRSILSVLAQTYRNFEIIVVDDCSRDNTQEIVKEFSDTRLRYIRRTENGRAAAARNNGLAAARGSLLAFQDDDDVWLPHKLERQVAALQEAPAEVGLLVCGYIRMNPDRIFYVGGRYYFDRLNYAKGDPKRINYGLIATPAWLLRREYLHKAGLFDVRMKSWDDWELGLRLWKICKFRHLDEPLFVQDHVEGSAMMRNEQAFYHDMRIILEKHENVWEKRPLTQAEHFYVVGKGECRFNSVAIGRQWLLKCVRNNPFHLRAWFTLLSSLGGRQGIEWAGNLSGVILRLPRAIARLLKRLRQTLRR